MPHVNRIYNELAPTLAAAVWISGGHAPRPLNTGSFFIIGCRSQRYRSQIHFGTTANSREISEQPTAYPPAKILSEIHLADTLAGRYCEIPAARDVRNLK